MASSTWDGTAATVLQCTRAHLRRSTARRAADDVLLLLAGIRTAVLWDYTGWDVDDDDRASCPSGLLAGLHAACPTAAHSLALLSVGPSLFMVHTDALANSCLRPLPGSDEGPRLVAVDQSLPEPRPCDETERLQISSMLGALAATIRDSLVSLVSAKPSAMRSDIRCLPGPDPEAGLVAVHGWLLEYPIVYCYLQADAAACCLAGRPLSVVQLWAARATRSMAASPAGGPSLVCSFSMPAEEDVFRAHASVGQWREQTEARFRKQTCWTLERIAVEVRVQESVAL